MSPQPDPQNPGGYIVSRVELSATEGAKTNNPMYAIWSKALETLDNTIVEGIAPNLASNPNNVKRAERVFGEAQWQFLTQMAAPEYTYTRFFTCYW